MKKKAQNLEKHKLFNVGMEWAKWLEGEVLCEPIHDGFFPN